MLRLLLSSAAIATLLIGGPASAADQAVRPLLKAPPIPVFSWTGFYIGANAGYHWGRDNITTAASTANFGATAASVINAAAPVTLQPQGWAAGGQIGQLDRIVAVRALQVHGGDSTRTMA